MFALIFIIILVIIIKFIYDLSDQKRQVARQGGMRHKYRHLVELLLGDDPRTKVFNETGDSISLGISNAGGTTLYTLTQTFGRVTVVWKVDNPVYGRHRLEWEFNEFKDQDEMMAIIANDLIKYQTNVLTKNS